MLSKYTFNSLIRKNPASSEEIRRLPGVMPECADANTVVLAQELTVHGRQLGYTLLHLPFSFLFSVPQSSLSVAVTVNAIYTMPYLPFHGIQDPFPAGEC